MGGIWSWFVGLLELALIWFSSVTGSITLGIILFTVAARLVILPLTLTSIRSSRRMQELQPMIKELQRKHGKDQQKLQEETLKLYRDYKINPVGGCLPMLLQLPIFFGVYQAVFHLFGGPAGEQFRSAAATARLQDPEVAAIFSQKLFGVLEVGGHAFGGVGLVTPSPATWIYLILPTLSILFQFVQTVMATPRVQDPQQKAMTQMMMFMPLVFGYIAFTFPQGAVLYWVVSSLIGIIQQYFTSGWGSLANYLKFLPPDGKPSSPTLTLAPAAVAVDAGAGAVAAPSAPRADFWSVMRPLTESPEPAGEPAAPPKAVPSAEEDAIEEARAQGRQPVNPRKPRRRK
jgi:YidC/Oxa1 family membrane protein insertase